MSRIEQALEKAALLRDASFREAVAIDKKGTSRSIPERPSVQLPPPGLGDLRESIDNPVIATLADPHSLISEEYRKLKSEIVAYARQAEFRNVIMVTSAVGGEGKSVTSLNLAISLAQEFDHTVLLVDADIRKPSIEKYLGLPPGKGLSDYLAGNAPLADLLVKTGIGRLTLLPAGTPLRNPVELCSSQKMKEFIGEIKNRYPDRFVIIDTPPVLPFAESRLLSALSDGVVFVIREGRATPENIGEALKTLDRNKLVGAVYNDATMQGLGGHYQNYYNSYGSYGYGYSPEPAGGKAPGDEGKGKPAGLFGRIFRK